MFAQLSVLLSKDMQAILRRGHFLAASGGFAALLVIVCSFAFRVIGYGQTELTELTPGIIWVIFLFSGVTVLGQSFIVEKENDALQGLLLAAGDPLVIYLSKFIANSVLLTFLQAFVIILHGLFFGVDYFEHFFFLLALSVFASVGFIALGTLLAAISTVSSGREILLPMLLFPLCLPLVAGVVSVTRVLLQEGVFPVGDFWFVMVLVFDTVSLVMSLLLFEFVARE